MLKVGELVRDIPIIVIGAMTRSHIVLRAKVTCIQCNGSIAARRKASENPALYNFVTDQYRIIMISRKRERSVVEKRRPPGAF